MNEAAHALGLSRRLMVSVGHGWMEQAQKENSRASLRVFVTGLRAYGSQRALNLITASAQRLGSLLEAAQAIAFCE